MNEVPRLEARASAAPPVANYLGELHARVAALTGGRPADYIPELGKADPSRFGIAIATVDGTIYAVGDADEPFTIQSVSKPFMYGRALQRHGRHRVLKKVGGRTYGWEHGGGARRQYARAVLEPCRKAPRYR